MSHEFNLLTLVTALVHWLIQLVLEKVPLLEPTSESRDPPAWWTKWAGSNLWYYYIRGPNYRPSLSCIQKALECLWREFGHWIEECATWARDAAQSWTRQITGYIIGGYVTFSAWIYAIDRRVGSFTAAWGSNIENALWSLYMWLPWEIRTGVRRWSDIWGGIEAAVRIWVASRYDSVRDWFYTQWAAYRHAITVIDAWYTGVRVTVNLIHTNPYAFVTSQLGPAWPVLSSMYTGLHTFYNMVWIKHSKTLVDFLSDPLGFLWDRAEDYILSKW